MTNLFKNCIYIKTPGDTPSQMNSKRWDYPGVKHSSFSFIATDILKWKLKVDALCTSRDEEEK